MAEPLVAFRLSGDDLAALKATAQQRGSTVSHVIRSALRADQALPSQQDRRNTGEAP